MNDAPELMPCPFCGCAAAIYHKELPLSSVWWVECAREPRPHHSLGCESKKEAIDEWNARANLTEDDLDEGWKSGFNAGFGEAVLTRPAAPAPGTAEALIRAERFIAGFEDDEQQHGIADLLADIRAVLRGEP